MIFQPSDFYTLQDNTKIFSERRDTLLYPGQQYNSLTTRILVNSHHLETDYFKDLMENFPQYISVVKTNHPSGEYFIYINFIPTQDSEWQQIILKNAQDIIVGGTLNIFSSISHALSKIKEFKIIKKTTDSLLLCQFGKYEKFLIYTNSAIEECLKVYNINIANRDDKLFISTDEIPLLEPNDISI